MPKIVQYCFFILAFLLPVQTVLAQYITNVLGLPDWLNFWKEFLCGIIMIVLLVDVVKKCNPQFLTKLTPLQGVTGESGELKTSPVLPLRKVPEGRKVFVKRLENEVFDGVDLSISTANPPNLSVRPLYQGVIGYFIQKKEFISTTLPLILIVLITILAFLSSFVFNKSVLKVFVYGFRFELWWLWFFAVVATWWNVSRLQNLTSNPPNLSVRPLYQGVTGEETELNKFPSLRGGKNEVFDGVDISTQHTNSFYKNLTVSIFLGFGLVAIISAATIFLGQNKVLTPFGFGNIKQGLVATAPICQVIDFGSDDCRLSGAFSTPNHFAGYLVLILPIFIITLSNRLKNYVELKQSTHQKIHIGLLAVIVSLILIFIYTSYSRFALLGLLSWFSFWLVSKFGKRFIGEKITLFTQVLTILVPLFIGIIGINLPTEITQKLPLGLGKPSSTIEHQRHTRASLDVLKESPKTIFTGLGLGSSGPAAKPEYQNLNTENNLFKKFAYISFRWYITPDRITIPENWYLQLILNGGLLYFILNLILILYVFKDVFYKTRKSNMHVLLAFFTIILGNLLLHIWENQTIALYWTVLWVWYEAYLSQTEDRVA